MNKKIISELLRLPLVGIGIILLIGSSYAAFNKLGEIGYSYPISFLIMLLLYIYAIYLNLKNKEVKNGAN